MYSEHQSSISTHLFLMFLLFKKYLNPHVRTKKFINKVVYHPCPWRLASGIFSLQNACWIFSDLYIPQCVGKFFQFMVFTLVFKCIESIHFYSYPSPPLKTPGRIFRKSVSPKTKGVRETMIYFINIQSENMKMTWNISLFTFCMIYNFSKWDGFTVSWTISIKLSGTKFIASSLKPWQFDTKITSGKMTDEGWLFIGRFKVGSLPRMINKEVLAQFIYKPI